MSEQEEGESVERRKVDKLNYECKKLNHEVSINLTTRDGPIGKEQ